MSGVLMIRKTVIPSEAARRAVQSRDLSCCICYREGSLHYASLREAPVGMTGILSHIESPALSEERSVSL